jgi:hypothetical protein
MLLLAILSSCAALHVRIAKKSTFDKVADSYYDTRLHTRAGILLPQVLIRQMPLYKNDSLLWEWYFKEGLRPVFDSVYLIRDMQELENNRKISLVVKPELWSWMPGVSYTVLGFKFVFLDRSGKERFAIKVEEVQTTKLYPDNLTQVLDQVMKRLQKAIIEKRDEILSISAL